jgi:MarR family transcriptional regulator for hemolysin
VTRRRDPANRRVHQVGLTEAGEALFASLLGTVAAFDERLRDGIAAGDLARLERVLDHLAGNATRATGGD